MRPTICLNMIVKNESRIITRLFDSALPIIDYYCICDTGSTDNTVEIIKSYFEAKGIQGTVVSEPFRDFGYNRSFALAQCKQGDYALLLDADMILEFGNDFNKDAFYQRLSQHNAHHLLQGSRNFNYKNARFVKTNINASYWGVTHEYLSVPENTTYGSFEPDFLFINDVGDGGCKSDKYLRDIRLLTKGLVENPNNVRYTFYLANSYRDSGQKTRAIDTYKKRAQLGGWIEEVWYSLYTVGILYKELGFMDKAIFYWLEAFTKFNRRIENLYEIVHYYRSNCNYELAYHFYRIASEKRAFKEDFLFMNHDIYNFKLDYEQSIIGYYNNPDKIDMASLCMRLMNYPNADKGYTNNVFSNYKYYCPVATGIPNNRIPTNQIDGFVSSTPSICALGDQYVVNTRYVNYEIDGAGNYINKDCIETVNRISVYDGSWNKVSPDITVLQDTSRDGHYKGIEDIRLFAYDSSLHGLDLDSPLRGLNKLWYNGNRGIDGKMYVEHGEIDMTSGETKSVILKMTDNQSPIEKNWVLFGDKHCIYGWNPLKIGTIDSDGIYTIQKTIQVPPIFERLRGSTNGVRIGDEYWFICHAVSYEHRRYYYHMFVALDANTFAVRRYSPFFTFGKEPVEYTLGFVEIGDDLFVGYSAMDSTTQYTYIAKDWVFSHQMI